VDSEKDFKPSSGSLYSPGFPVFIIVVLLIALCLIFARNVRAQDGDLPPVIMWSVAKVEAQRTLPPVFENGQRVLPVKTNHGTAFAVDVTNYKRPQFRYVLTNAHVVFDPVIKDGKLTGYVESETIRLVSPKVNAKAKVLAVDHDEDLCLLLADADFPAKLALADELPREGDKVLLMGGPGPAYAGPYDGYFVSGAVNGGDRCQIAVQFFHGCSGGPFLRGVRVFAVAVGGVPDGKGELIPGVATAIPLTTVRGFLEKALKVKRGD